MAEQKLLVKREGDFHYPIYFENDFKNLARALKEEGLDGRKICIVTDSHVAPLYLDSVKTIFQEISSSVFSFEFEAGEKNKNLSTVQELYKTLIENEMDRKGLLVALGGGVVGDLAGFVASTYMRGIDVCQIPTSLLAQVDSSVGGKTGLNIGNLKNVIGTFYQPKFTYINIDALKTLPHSEFISGMAEVIKYSLIYDYDFLDYLIDNSEKILDKDNETLCYMVEKCIQIKADIVSKDEKEGGLRKILNFGHTFGHGVEKLCKISHGEAVSIGMNMAFKLSLEKGCIDESYYNKFIHVCEKFNLPLGFNLPLHKEDEITERDKDKINKEILEIMKNDKKNSFGKINLILPIDFGKVEITDNIDEDEILNIIKGANHA